MALALGLCWRRFRTRTPYRGDALAYSTAVIDTLLGEGAPYGEILSAGNDALGLCLVGLVVTEPDPRPFSETPSGPVGGPTAA